MFLIYYLHICINKKYTINYISSKYNMDIIKLYYYTSIPLLTCNILFYAITSLSNSITSSQNVFKFIVEHKDCDSIIFKNKMINLDLENKLKIVEAIIYDIIKKFSANNEEFELTKNELQNPQIIVNSTELQDKTDFLLVETKLNPIVLERINEPIKIAIISTSETVTNINTIIQQIICKISNYKKSYNFGFISLSLQQELSYLDKQVKLLDSRLQLLFELLKIYLPIQIK